MSAALRFLESGDVRWDPVVMGMGHDVYHLRGYATACEAQQADPVVLAVAELDGHAVAAPFIVRPVPESLPGAAGLRDAVAPYGYPALICTSEDLRVQAKLLRSLVESMRSQGLVSAFVRCNPFVGLDRSVLREQAEVVRHGELVVVDIDSLPDAAEASFRLNHQRNIRQLREAGFRIRIDHPADRASFPGLYRDRMREVNANPYYLFPDSYFDALFESLGEHARLVAVLNASNELAAAVILFVSGTFAHYHLGASPEEYSKAAPMKLAVLGMIDVCRESGVERLNLGSGLGGRADSLFEFKLGFSTGTVPFEDARIVLDPELYREWSTGGSPAGFFPAYRVGY